eukprot:5522147-Pleurochrysis_carterae.AAC.1
MTSGKGWRVKGSQEERTVLEVDVGGGLVVLRGCDSFHVVGHLGAPLESPRFFAEVEAEGYVANSTWATSPRRHGTHGGRSIACKFMGSRGVTKRSFLKRMGQKPLRMIQRSFLCRFSCLHLSRAKDWLIEFAFTPALTSEGPVRIHAC